MGKRANDGALVISFVPTHALKDDIPALGLARGTLVRQTNLLAADEFDWRYCLDETDWRDGGRPWILLAADLVELPAYADEVGRLMNRRIS